MRTDAFDNPLFAYITRYLLFGSCEHPRDLSRIVAFQTTLPQVLFITNKRVKKYRIYQHSRALRCKAQTLLCTTCKIEQLHRKCIDYMMAYVFFADQRFTTHNWINTFQ